MSGRRCRTPGLIHVVVVSGLKVVLIVGCSSAFARDLEWSRRRTLLVAVPVVAVYVLVSGAGPAAVRSARWPGGHARVVGGRRTDPYRCWRSSPPSCSVCRPRWSTIPGFQLSFSAPRASSCSRRRSPRSCPGPACSPSRSRSRWRRRSRRCRSWPERSGSSRSEVRSPTHSCCRLLPFMIVSGGLGAILSALRSGLGWVLLQRAQPRHVA